MISRKGARNRDTINASASHSRTVEQSPEQLVMGGRGDLFETCHDRHAAPYSAEILRSRMTLPHMVDSREISLTMADAGR